MELTEEEKKIVDAKIASEVAKELLDETPTEEKEILLPYMEVELELQESLPRHSDRVEERVEVLREMVRMLKGD